MNAALALLVPLLASVAAPTPIQQQAVAPPPTVVTCELRYISVPRADVSQLVTGSTYVLNDSVLQQLQKMIEAKKAVVLAQPKVVGLSGVSAQIKAVREVIYPSEYTEPQVGNGVRPDDNNHDISITVPAAFKTREVGTILNVTPTVSPDGRVINLALTPEVSQLSKLGFVKHVSVTPAGKVEIPQPDFDSWSLNTIVVLTSGSTVLLGVIDQVADEQYIGQDHVILILLNAAVKSAY